MHTAPINITCPERTAISQAALGANPSSVTSGYLHLAGVRILPSPEFRRTPSVHLTKVVSYGHVPQVLIARLAVLVRTTVLEALHDPPSFMTCER